MTFTGIVIHGSEYARKLGFPTVNIEISKPLSGIFVGMVEHKSACYQAVLFSSPSRSVLEAHLLDFHDDLYGEHVVMHIYEQLRENQNFSDEASLRRAIQSDVRRARQYFAGGSAVRVN